MEVVRVSGVMGVVVVSSAVAAAGVGVVIFGCLAVARWAERWALRWACGWMGNFAYGRAPVPYATVLWVVGHSAVW